MFRYFVYPVYLLNEIFSFSSLFLFLSFDDYLPPCTILRHKQVYVSFLVGNKLYNR